VCLASALEEQVCLPGLRAYFPIQNLLNGKSGFLFPPVREGEQTSFDYEERKYV